MMSMGLTQILSTVLGITITVSLILVQMAANRYLPQIIDLFFHWKIYLIPLCTFIFSIIYINFSSSALGTHVGFFHIFLFFFSLGLLVPYFYLLFDFLKPVNIIKRMSHSAVEFMNKGKRKMMEEQIAYIGRMGKSSISHMTSEIPIVAINSESDIMLRHLSLKRELPPKWFEVDENDFLGTPPQAIMEINKNKTWFEMKIFHDFVTMFTFILNSPYKLRDVVTSILINARVLGEKSQEAGDEPVLNLSLKFFNTFCRLALNSKDRTIAYNILYQYRLLAEELLDKNEEASLKIANFIKYYGTLAENSGFPYVLETAIYDLMILNCAACEKKSKIKKQLLDNFLNSGKENKRIYRDFVKRCLMLGGFYLLNKDEEFLPEIIHSIKYTGLATKECIEEIEKEILNVYDPDFWEITDRIINFDYVNMAHREKIKDFIGKLISQ